jgi:protein-tyrosine phosphatase
MQVETTIFIKPNEINITNITNITNDFNNTDCLSESKIDIPDSTHECVAGGGATAPVTEYELPPRNPDSCISNLNLNIIKCAKHKWTNCEFVYSPLKDEYQVRNVSIAHWGINGQLIIGACPVPQKITQYPSSNKNAVKDQTRTVLTSLIKEHKITKFISLMAECLETNDENTQFRSYSKLDLPSIDPSVTFDKLEIVDCNITDDIKILKFAIKIVKLLEAGEKIYLHCWGGHGRAGTVFCIVLHLIYGMCPEDTLNFCQRVHDVRQSWVKVGSPQTAKQGDQVKNIIRDIIESHPRFTDFKENPEFEEYINDPSKMERAERITRQISDLEIKRPCL